MKDSVLIIEAFKTIGYNRKAQDNFSAILITFTDEHLEMAPITKEQNITCHEFFLKINIPNRENRRRRYGHSICSQ